MTDEEAASLLMNISTYDIENGKRGEQKQEAIEMGIQALLQNEDECRRINHIFIVMSEPSGDIYDHIERIFTKREDAEKYAAYLKKADDTHNKYKYYIKERVLFDLFDEEELNVIKED